MKKIITLALLMGTITLVKSQNNLIFNQTINLTLSPNQEITVPDGKTWKIELANVNDPNGINSFEIISLNTTGASATNTVYTSGSNLNAAHLIWLKAGSRVKSRGNSLFLSALEFNIEPISSSSGTNTVSGGVSSEGMVFNKVVKRTFTGTYWGEGTSLQTIGAITIPSGKIWKIHNIDTYYFTSSGGNEGIVRGNLFDTVLIGDNLIKSPSDVTFLVEGTYVFKIKTDGNPLNTIVIQAIEYNQ